MAYMSQENKAKIKAGLVKIMPKGWKWSLSVNNHSTIVLTIQSAPVDIIQNYMEANKKQPSYRQEQEKPSYMGANPYWLDTQFSGDVLELMKKIKNVMYSADYYDNSEPMTDYFDCAYYVNINIGKWNKPFQVA